MPAPHTTGPQRVGGHAGCRRVEGGTYTATMLFAEKVWHFWLAVPIAAGAVLAVIAVLGLYAARVTKTRYPNNDS